MTFIKEQGELEVKMNSWVAKIFIYLLLPIVFGCNVSYADDPVASDADSDLVTVEQNDSILYNHLGEPHLSSYEQRKKNFSVLIGLQVNQFNPTNYYSNVVTRDYSTGFTGDKRECHMQEINVGLKWNSVAGGWALEVGYTNDQMKFNNDTRTSKLSTQSHKMGAVYYFDLLHPEPFVVPYVGGGLYSTKYSEDTLEKDSASATSGTTSYSSYLKAGIMFQINWLDNESSIEAYHNSGLENAFIVGEYMVNAKSTKSTDPDLSSNGFGVGLRFEY